MNSQAFHSSILIWFTSSFRLWENSEKLKCEEQSVSNCSWYAASYLGLGQLLWDKTLFFLLFSSFLKKICPMQVVSCYLISRPSVFNCCNKTMFVWGETLSRAGHQVFEKGAPRIPIRDRPKTDVRKHPQNSCLLSCFTTAPVWSCLLLEVGFVQCVWRRFWEYSLGQSLVWCPEICEVFFQVKVNGCFLESSSGTFQEIWTSCPWPSQSLPFPECPAV